MTRIETRFKPLIERLNNFIITYSRSNRSILNTAITDLVCAGGKRLRPILMILAGKFGNFQEEKMLKIASGLELLHMATLVHDDIIDEAKLRRGKVTVQEKFGKDIAVFVGDFLLSKAYTLFSQNLAQTSLNRLNKTVRLICEGEIGQYQEKYNYNISIYDYLRRIRRKTALLFGISTYLGAYEAGLRGFSLYNLYNFGLELGMIFQIQDDLLDFTGDKEKVGKEIGQDMATGVYTLPLIYLLNDARFALKTREILDKGHRLTSGDIREINQMIRESDALEKSREMGQRYLDKASRHLEKLPDQPYKEDLQFILVAQLSRRY